jgi:hypothetical protein
MEHMVTCLSIGVYDDALTRGRKYLLLASNARNIKIRNNRGRNSWYPVSLFDLRGEDVPVLLHWKFDNDINDDTSAMAEVSFELSDGAKRWSLFVTPEYIVERLSQKSSENWLWAHHLIIVGQITVESVSEILSYLDQHNSLEDASKALSS